MKSDRLRSTREWLVAAGFLIGGLAILVLGGISYWQGVPVDTIWITGDERAPQLRAALVSGILHMVYSAPQLNVPSESRQELAGFYFRQVTYGGTGAFGVGLPFWFLAGGVLSAAVIAYRRGPRRRARRRRRGECIHCGYPLAGLTEPRCPECGRAFISTNVVRSTPATCRP
ncbi:MAG TPA: hypothetical protein PLP66_12230 [Phycisphaerae bacterium]|jgi:hypothetical protein|nr:hypothetical protein [Phycisphaerae bacterium]